MSQPKVNQHCMPEGLCNTASMYSVRVEEIQFSQLLGDLNQVAAAPYQLKQIKHSSYIVRRICGAKKSSGFSSFLTACTIARLHKSRSWQALIRLLVGYLRSIIQNPIEQHVCTYTPTHFHCKITFYRAADLAP
jgi:hypothetical protein